jgi:hypothetical protein
MVDGDLDDIFCGDDIISCQLMEVDISSVSFVADELSVNSITSSDIDLNGIDIEEGNSSHVYTSTNVITLPKKKRFNNSSILFRHQHNSRWYHP